MQVGNNFISYRTVRLKDTDATGVIYFTTLLTFATEAFEEYLVTHKFLQNQKLPIYEAKAKYLAPVRWNDKLKIVLTIDEVRSASFSLVTQFFHKNILVGETQIIHVLQKDAIHTLD